VKPNKVIATAFFIGATIVAGSTSALAQAGAAPSAPPGPSVSPSPSPPSDPCSSILSIVNRPTFGTGVCTVRTGQFLIENGYTNTTTTGFGGGNTALYPQSLLRFGTSDAHLDLEFGAPSEERSSVGGPAIGGATDLSLGAKYELGYTSNFLWGVNAVVTVPSGSAAFTAGNAQFTGNFNWGYTINSVLGLAGTMGVNAFSATNSGGVPQSYFAFMPSLEVTAGLPGPSQLAAEYAYFSSAGPNEGGKSWFDFVYARDLGSHVQVDVEYGFSPTLINGQKQDYVGAGVSFMH
jgi:hypothetical protein